MDKNGCMMAAILNVQDGGQKVFDENGNGFKKCEWLQICTYSERKYTAQLLTILLCTR